MHKCQNCGTEFESKFCPNCGTPAPAEVCPYCGAAVSPENKFCPECGKALGAAQPAAQQNASPLVPSPNGANTPSPAQPVQPAQPAATQNAAPQPVQPAQPAAPQIQYVPVPTAERMASPALVKLLSFLPYATAAFFAIFSAIFFLMCLGAVSSVMGMGTGSVYDYLSMGGESGGEFFDLLGGGTDELAGMGTIVNSCAALVALGAIGGALAICVLFFRMYTPFRHKKVGDVRICTILEGVVFCMYLADLIIASVLCGSVSDEMTAPGAAPVCILVFSILFLLFSMGAKYLWKHRTGICPVAAAQLKEQTDLRRAALTPPVPPKKVEKPNYKTPVKCNEAKSAAIAKYEKAQKLFIVLAAIGAAIAILTWLFSATIPYMMSDTNSHTFLGHALANVERGNLNIAMICAWPIAFGLYFILGGSIGAAYYKKKRPNPLRQPERVLSDKGMITTAIVLPIIIFVIDLILARILYNTYVKSTLDDPLGPYMNGALLLNMVIVACYLVGELPFVFGICKKRKKLRAAVYPGEAAYRNYKAQLKLYNRRRAYYEEGVKY